MENNTGGGRGGGGKKQGSIPIRGGNPSYITPRQSKKREQPKTKNVGSWKRGGVGANKGDQRKKGCKGQRRLKREGGGTKGEEKKTGLRRPNLGGKKGRN